MSDKLIELERSLIQLEELLGFELDKLRNQIKDQIYVSINEKRHIRLMKHYKKLQFQLDYSGNRSQLELMTDIHELLRTRLAIIKVLLGASQIGSAYLEVSHQDIINSRNRLEKRVVARRKKLAIGSSTSQRPRKTDQISFRPVSTKEKSLNRLNVTRAETAELEDVRSSSNTSIYSAARELKVLAAYIRIHKDKAPPVPKGRAFYVSKELSHNVHNDVKEHVEELKKNKSKQKSDVKKIASLLKKNRKKKLGKDIAQTPEDIRKKLEARGTAGTTSGLSVFEARDVYSETEELGGPRAVEIKPRKEKPKKKPPLPRRNPDDPIAQTPEDIRRKLEERKKEAGQAADKPKEKAVFGSVDLTPNR